LGLLAVVAAASSARAASGGVASSPWLVLALLAPLVALVVLLALGGSVAIAYASLGVRARAIALVAVAAAVFATPLVAIAVNSWRPSHGEYLCHPMNSYRCKHGKDTGGRKVRGGEPSGGIGTESALLIAAGSLVGLVLLAGGAVLLVRRRRAAAESPATEETFAAAVEESLDDLRTEADVRRAIIACYARMERAFARAGRGRRPAEAPLEFLRRVLMAVAPAAGGRLTELFERAAFSVEPMGVVERERAVAALEALRGALH
jgi:hypothetical protein